MNKTVKILAILLAAQLLLAVGIGFSDRGVSSGNEPVALVSFDADKIDRITLEGPENAKVALAKRDGNSSSDSKPCVLARRWPPAVAPGNASR